jgi:ribosomal protein S27AE
VSIVSRKPLFCPCCGISLADHEPEGLRSRCRGCGVKVRLIYSWRILGFLKWITKIATVGLYWYLVFWKNQFFAGLALLFSSLYLFDFFAQRFKAARSVLVLSHPLRSPYREIAIGSKLGPGGH